MIQRTTVFSDRVLIYSILEGKYIIPLKPEEPTEGENFPIHYETLDDKYLRTHSISSISFRSIEEAITFIDSWYNSDLNKNTSFMHSKEYKSLRYQFIDVKFDTVGIFSNDSECIKRVRKVLPEETDTVETKYQKAATLVFDQV